MMTLTMKNRLTLPLLFAAAMALSACTKKDQVAADLLSLNAAGKAATQNIDLQNSMGRVQSAKSNEEKAAILRESAAGLTKIQSTLQKIDIKSPEVKDIQARLTGAFGKVSGAAGAAAAAFEKSDTAALDQAGKVMQESQREIASVGNDVVRLAKEHKVDLNKQP